MSSSEGYQPPPPQQYSPQYAPPPQYASGSSSRRVIKRIDVLSAGKVFAVASALIVAVFGLFFVLLAICGLFSSLTGNNGGGGGVGGGVVLFGYVIGGVVYGILGFIVGGLYFRVLKIGSPWVGGPG